MSLHTTANGCCSVALIHPCRYGGLACRDLMAMARGLLEVTDEAYQEYRHG